MLMARITYIHNITTFCVCVFVCVKHFYQKQMFQMNGIFNDAHKDTHDFCIILSILFYSFRFPLMWLSHSQPFLDMKNTSYFPRFAKFASFFSVLLHFRLYVCVYHTKNVYNIEMRYTFEVLKKVSTLWRKISFHFGWNDPFVIYSSVGWQKKTKIQNV